VLKEEVKDLLVKRAEELDLGSEAFLDLIADESVGETEEEILEFITEKGHPVLEMDPMF
jgi:acetyl-CoA synthase